jgi:hypothetical protein
MTTHDYRWACDACDELGIPDDKIIAIDRDIHGQMRVLVNGGYAKQRDTDCTLPWRFYEARDGHCHVSFNFDGVLIKGIWPLGGSQ